jgi:hypothetical protein
VTVQTVCVSRFVSYRVHRHYIGSSPKVRTAVASDLKQEMRCWSNVTAHSGSHIVAFATDKSVVNKLVS